MARVEKSITINAPVEKAFAYTGEPTNNVEWLPSMIEVKDVTGQGVGAHYCWTYKMAGLRFEGESTVTEHVPNEWLVVQSKGGIVSTWTWNFTPMSGGTRVDLAVEYTVPVPALGKLAEALLLKQNDREAEQAMANIKAKMEA